MHWRHIHARTYTVVTSARHVTSFHEKSPTEKYIINYHEVYIRHVRYILYQLPRGGGLQAIAQRDVLAG